ncbi:uncharacterized protein LOC133036919 [Cannabis sativa]|uniref:uncharacterized protein LOC133036919 n=1 Tax=Cannabis sativa TaxID=3483 RepID=UPI0029CA6FEE|nr:uncharacterized protein LOC133036919 [Cannabis sativa]
MKVLAWNCRGLGNSTTVRQLANLVRQHKPEVLVLSETRLPQDKFSRTCIRLHFEHSHYVPPVGLSGGLGICWMKGVNCNIKLANKHVIIGEISSDPPGCLWQLYGTYGPPHRDQKEVFWKHLGDLAINATNPILLLGDMNGTLRDSDCFNYTQSRNVALYSFDYRRMIQRVGLIDLGFQGPRFTWAKGGGTSNPGTAMKRARLDTGLASPDWRVLFPNAIINHLSASGSDHRPLLLDTLGGTNCKSKLFKYENMWARDPRSFWIVKEAWAKRQHSDPMLNFFRKVKATTKKLQHWNKTQFQNVHRQVQKAQAHLQDTETKNPDDYIAIELASQQLNEALKREEIHWQQKSRVQWLQEGDTCSKFFIASTIVRRRRNYIQCIKNNPGEDWIRDDKEIAQCFIDKFRNLFKKHQCTHPSFQQEPNSTIVTTQDNVTLNMIPTREEITAALFGMGKDKAPGPDGLPPSFYAHHWDTVQDDLFEMVTHFFTNTDLPKYINDTAIVLVPKKDSPAMVNDYRPIALCNVAYKVISKVIATRLRSMLHKSVSPNQAAFIKGRHIAENTMIAREIIHSMKRRRGKKGFMLIKLDLEKAYDKMDWEFIIKVLYQFGFTSPFTDWIKACISVEEIKLLLNGSIVGKFSPGRGLRQGDPLSPSLFIIAAETLSRLLFEKEKLGLLKGFKMARNGTAINHLMFADDIVLFGEASIREAKVFLECLQTYCNWSGQSVSAQKSAIHFSQGVSRRKSQAISQLLGMKQMGRNATYLGLPLFKSRKKSNDTKGIIDKTLKRVQGWKARLLSSAGKTCLVKSVGSTLSNYVASSDVIPVSAANKIDKILRDFWWGDTEERRKIHTVAWERLCRPKVVGGLGFRSIEAMNKAYLMKWAWRILTQEDCLWGRIINGKYIKSENFMELEAKSTDSALWKAILKTRPLLWKGMCRKIGDGNSTSIWFDPWVPGEVTQPAPTRNATDGISLVSNFIRNNQWNRALIRSWFCNEDAKRILNISLPITPKEDGWLWIPEPNGMFSVKSAYRIVKNVQERTDADEKWRIVWGAKIHNRQKLLWWKILCHSLLTKEKLAQIFPSIDIMCPLCSAAPEDSLHLFWDCDFARGIWFGCNWQMRTSTVMIRSWDEWLKWFSITHHRHGSQQLDSFLGGAAIIFESIWRVRNKLCHEGNPTPICLVIQGINQRLKEIELQNSNLSATFHDSQGFAPPPGWLICNSDISIGKSQSAGASIFFDEDNRIVKIVTFLSNYCVPLPGELHAISKGAESAVSLGYKNVIFLSDSAAAIDAIRIARSDCNNLHYNLRELIPSFLTATDSLCNWETHWISRRHNGVAHALAKWANQTNTFGTFDLSDFDGSLQSWIADGCVVDMRM